VSTFDDIMASAKPRETSVTICVAGDLAGQHEALNEQLIAAQRKQVTSIEGNPEAVALAQQIRDLEQQMQEATHAFTFRAMSARDWSNLVAEHPARADKSEAFNVETLPLAVIKACIADPVMTGEQVDRLAGVLSDAAFDALFDAAWRANKSGPSVPFSKAASATLQNSEPK
jgi:hypothetical protein